MEENTGQSNISTTEKLSNLATGIITSGVESLARTSVGQAILKLVDRFLWVIEKSSQWSLPNQEDSVGEEENGKTFGTVELVRPLPWVLFLPVLLALRIFRMSANAGAFVLGYERIQPTAMVKQVQKFRRRLRMVKCTGIKNMRQHKSILDKQDSIGLTVNEARKMLIKSIRITLSSLSCLESGSRMSPSPPPMRIRVSNNELEVAPSQTAEEKSTTESTGSPIHADGKRKFSDISSSEDTSSDESDAETLQSKIERLAMENSEDDEDFCPGEDEEEEHQSESDTSSLEDDENQCQMKDELEELLKDLKSDNIIPIAVYQAQQKQEALAALRNREIQNEKKDQVEAFLENLKQDENSLTAVASDESAPKSVVEKVNDERNNETGGTAKAASLIPRLYSAESFDDDRGDYASPKTDVETTFYSPVSSKSGSPEPERTVISGQMQDSSHQQVGGDTKMRDENASNEFGNGEVKCSTPESTNTSEEMTNGQGTNSAKRYSFQANQKSASAHQKGKGKINHGNRKKK